MERELKRGEGRSIPERKHSKAPSEIEKNATGGRDREKTEEKTFGEKEVSLCDKEVHMTVQNYLLFRTGGSVGTCRKTNYSKKQNYVVP